MTDSSQINDRGRRWEVGDMMRYSLSRVCTCTALFLLGVGCSTPAAIPAVDNTPSKLVKLRLHNTDLARVLSLLEEKGGVEVPAIPSAGGARRVKLWVEDVPADEVLSAIGTIYPELELGDDASYARPIPGTVCADRLRGERRQSLLYATYHKAPIYSVLELALDWARVGFVWDPSAIDGLTISLEVEDIPALVVLDAISEQYPNVEFRFTENLVVIKRRAAPVRDRKLSSEPTE